MCYALSVETHKKICRQRQNCSKKKFMAKRCDKFPIHRKRNLFMPRIVGNDLLEVEKRMAALESSIRRDVFDEFSAYPRPYHF